MALVQSTKSVGSVTLSRDVVDVLATIPETSLPTTDVNNMNASLSGSTYSLVYDKDGVEKFTIQITNVTTNSFSWTITVPSLFLQESGFVLLHENSDEIALEG